MDSHKEILKKAVEAFDSGSYAEALGLLSGVSKEGLTPKKRVEVYYMEGVCLYETGERERAAQALKEAVKLNGHFAPALAALGNLLAEEGKLHAAIAKLRMASKANPNWWEPFYHWGYILKKMGSPKAALRKFLAALTRNPDLVEAYIHAGDCAFQLSRFREALSSYTVALEKGGPSSDLLSRLGNAYQVLGEREKAVQAYRDCVAMDPLDGSGYENWGLLLHQEGKLEEAAAKYEEGLLHASDSPTLLLRHGEVLAQMEKLSEAVLPLEKALTLLDERVRGEWGLQWSSILADCAYMLGYVHRRLGEHEKAREFFLLALRYSPNHLNALHELAIMRGVYREHHVTWEFVVEGKVEGAREHVKGLRAYRVAALTLDEALHYVRECEEEIGDDLKAKDVTHTEQVASYAGVLARGPLFLLARAS